MRVRFRRGLARRVVAPHKQRGARARNQGPRASPAQRVAWGEDEQGSGAHFRRQAETERSGLCEDDVAPHNKGKSESVPGQRYHSMAHFIQVAIQIIQEEGLNALSIRKVAQRAGYNSATLYYYFSNFEELCIFSCMHLVDKYAKELQNYLAQARTPLEKYLKIWECFCIYSFRNPDEFWLLFFKHLEDGEKISQYFKEYYLIFPENWTDEVREYEEILTSGDLYEREYLSLVKSLGSMADRLSEEEIYKINEMNILIYRGMLAFMRENSGRFTPEEATEKTVEYMRHTLRSYEML